MNKRARNRKWSFAIVCVLVVNMLIALIPIHTEAAVKVVDSVQINNMDSATNAVGDTTGGVAVVANTDPQYIKEGTGSKKWYLFKPDGSGNAPWDVYPKSGPQHDWSKYNQLSFWAYSTKIRPEPNKPIRIKFFPVNNTAPTASNYYYVQIPLDWTGWKKIEIPFDVAKSQKVGAPAPWGSIDYMKFDPAPTGGVALDSEAIMYIDDVRLDNKTDVEIAPVAATPPSGTYMEPIRVQLSTPTVGASVYYQVYGSGQPYTLYQGPLAIDHSQTLVTKSVLGDMSSEETTYTYTIASNASKDISDTETFGGWTNITKVSTPVKEGQYSGKWKTPTSAINVNDITADWAQYDQLELWAYSGAATNNKIYMIIDCDVPSTGYDYFIMPVAIDWTGWKKLTLPLSKFTKSTANTNFANYRRLIIHPRWYATDPQPNPNMDLVFDSLKLTKKMIELSTPTVEKYALPGSTVNYSVTLQNKSGTDAQYDVSLDPDRTFGADYKVTTPGVTASVPALGELEINVQVQVPQTAAVNEAKQAAVRIKSLRDGAEEEALLKLNVAAWQPSQQQHPYVLMTQEQLTKAKEKAVKYGWAKDYVAAIVKKADEWVNTPMVVPDKPGGHAIWYYCGDTPLIYDYTKPHEHVCPTDGKIYSGGDYDFAWRGTTHRRNIDAVRYMALAYTFTGDIRYAQKAKDVLVQYANYYPSYPLQTRYGRLFWQTLDEAVQVIKLAQAYDILYNSGLFTADEQFNIEFNLFKQSAATLKGYDMTISNWQTWHNAAIGVIGVLLHDQDLIDVSVSGKSGFHYQMASSVLSDGFWWEGAINYHFYSQQALFIHAETLMHAGIDLFADPTLKKTFDVTLEYAFPDLGIINNNDSNNYPTNLAGGPDDAVALDYEGLYSRYKEPSYGVLLNKIYNEHQVPRGGFNNPNNPYIINGEQAVLYGEDTINTAGSLPSASRNFEGIGHAVLRTGAKEAEQKYALVDYGLHGASHGNFDKLHLEIFGYGERLAPDPGVTSTYGVSLYQEYYKKTLSHNTVVVDGKDQAIQKQGNTEVFDPTKLFLDSPNFKITTNTASKVYPELDRYQRTVAMTPDYMLDIFSVGSAMPHTYDWVLHGMGQFTAGQVMNPMTGAIGSANGYQYFRNGTQASMSGIGDNRWVTPNGNGLRWMSVNQSPSTLYAGELPGPASSPDYTTAVVDRVYGSDAQFVSILEPYHGESKIDSVRRLSADRIGVKLKDGRKQVLYYTEVPVEGQVSYYYADGHNYDEDKISLSSAMKGSDLQLNFKAQGGVKRMTAVIYAPNAQHVTLNGKPVAYSVNNGYVLVQIKDGKQEKDENGDHNDDAAEEKDVHDGK